MTITFNRMILPVLVATLGLSACSSEKDKGFAADAVKLAVDAAKAKKSSSAGSAVGGFTLTRAQVSSIEVPLDLVTIESRGATGAIFQIAPPGGVETGASQDKISLSLRNGIVVATRGLGDDLMSAAVPKTTQLQSVGTTYQRSHTVLDGEDKPVAQSFDCQVRNRVAEQITVLERSYATQHVTEACSGPSGQFENEYWLQTGENIRKSRQFISKSVGYVVIEHLQ
jgi:hypothetical protein